MQVFHNKKCEEGIHKTTIPWRGILMLRIDNVKKFVFEYFSENGSDNGIDSNTVAEALGIWRNDASSELNALVERGILRKQGNRPILFFPVAADTEPTKAEPVSNQVSRPESFVNIIGYDGSLKLQVQLAKAAALYPPNGMHTLLTGETGVGKTLLAEEIWKYISGSRPDQKIPFIVFNCSEYADNPQLLLSQLFGHEKGSFTGADTDKAGMIEKAGGGVLLLDEIHRLPSTGQEMFFTVIDKGLYRRLGSTVERYVNLMIIGATTESPESALLDTFKRRIPMLIHVPNLSVRPIKERLELVLFFLGNESKRLRLPIKISNHALKILVAYESKMNIGDLRNEIQISCARSYMTYLNQESNQQDCIQIDGYHLSRKINTGYVWQDAIDKLVDSMSKSGEWTIHPDDNRTGNVHSKENSMGSLDFYGFIEKRIAAYKKEKRSYSEIELHVSLDLRQYYDEMVRKIDAVTETSSVPSMYTTISNSVAAISSEIIRLAELEFDRYYSQGIRVSIASFLEQTKSFAKAGRVLFNKEIDGIARHCTAEKEFLRANVKSILEGLDIFLTDGEIAVLALLLAQPDLQDKKTHIGFIILAHGDAVASGMAAFANEIIGASIVRSIDVPIDCSPEKLLENLCHAVHEYDQGLGVIIMSDISAVSIIKQLQEHVSSKCHIVPFISTSLTIDVCKAILSSKQDIEEIVLNVIFKFRNNMQSVLLAQEFSPDTNYNTYEEDSKERNVIFTYCVTGTGSARMARELLLKEHGFSLMADIIPLGMTDDIHNKAQKLGGRLKLVIGHFDPGIDGIPFIGMESLLTQEGLNRIKILLDEWNVNQISMKSDVHPSELSLDERLQHINRYASQFAPSLPTDSITQQATHILNSIHALYIDPLLPEMSVRIYIHSLAMFERLLTVESVPLSIVNAETAKSHGRFFNTLKSILNDACSHFDETVSDTEVYYLMATLPNPETMEVNW